MAKTPTIPMPTMKTHTALVRSARRPAESRNLSVERCQHAGVALKVFGGLARRK